MNYVCFKRFKDNAICGKVNIPYSSILENDDGLLKFNGKPICFARSQNAHDYFAVNDDGRGLERGNLTSSIIKLLSKRDKSYQERWDKIWSDLSLLKYKREEDPDYWMWNHDFYCAPVEELERIKKMITEV